MAHYSEDAMPDPISPVSPFSAPYAPDDSEIAARLLAMPSLSTEQNGRIDKAATRLIEAVRSENGGFGGVEDMLREFSLSTKEGLALMVMAEALLRVPDAATADRFIEDKLGQGDFAHHRTKSSALLVNASTWALGLSARVIQPGETPQGTIGVIAKRLDGPYVPGKREMVKIKHARDADCVAIGYRIHKSGEGVGSILLGLYRDDGQAKLRQSHNNPAVTEMYAKFAGRPLSPLAEELFHTRYIDRTKLGGIS